MRIAGHMSRIDPLAPPPPLAPKEKKPLPDWLKFILVSVVGAGVGALCPFLESPPLRAVCVAVSTVVGVVGRAIPDAGL